MAKVAVLAIHGIGETRRGYSEALAAQLRRALGKEALNELCFVEIDYQRHLQGNQERLWARVRQGLRWTLVRRFLLFYFGDAAAVLYNSRDLGSIYLKAQRTIYEAAAQALRQLEHPDCPVVIIAQSLGCQIVSSYLWDAQHSRGIWDPRHAAALHTEGPEYDAFLKLSTTRYFLTTGCNLPLVVSGLTEVVPIDKPNANFRWLNFYDPDDPLGWPLEDLYSYTAASARPEDVVVNVGNILTGWNPLSHGAYWTSPAFIQPASRLLRELLAENRA